MPELTVDEAFHHALSLHRAGQRSEAESLYRKILEINPCHSDSIHLLGMIAHQRGDFTAAVALVEQALALSPDTAIFHNNLGQSLEALGRRTEAALHYERALALAPNYAVAHNNLANMRERADRFPEAIAGYRRALELDPDYAEAYTNLGNIYKDQGELDQAIALYRAAIARRSSSLLHDNLLFALHYHPSYGPVELAREHRDWSQRYAEPLKSRIRPHANDRDPRRRLRIGYVSGDLREHPVARFMLPLLEAHDRTQVELFVYSDVARPDAITGQLRAAVDVWRDVAFRSDADVAALVRADAIDVLVDLASHSALSRLPAFAEKPAPVQITYLAYCSTTGLDTIDYRLSDPYLDPPDTDLSHYVEKTFRLPNTYWCYPPPQHPAAQTPVALREQRGVTFGCLNNFCKVTPPTLQAWGRILRTVPNSELIVHARPGDHRDRVRAALSAFGVKHKRVRFVGKQSLDDYLATYREIDIALDPFPFAGGTTSCDALWMGMPVVSLAGQTAVSRGGLSLLSNLGLPELVGHTTDDYVRIAAELAQDRPRLAQLRRELRPRMLASPLMDIPRFVREIEAAYRTMWQAWCVGTAG